MNNLQSEMKHCDLSSAIESGVYRHASDNFGHTPEDRLQNLLFLLNSESLHISKLLEQRPVEDKESISEWESTIREYIDKLEINYYTLKADDLYKKLIANGATIDIDSVKIF